MPSPRYQYPLQEIEKYTKRATNIEYIKKTCFNFLATIIKTILEVAKVKHFVSNGEDEYGVHTNHLYTGRGTQVGVSGDMVPLECLGI